MNYRMTHIYLDTASSHWNFRVRTPADVLRVLDDDRLMFVFDRCMGDPGFETQARIGAVVKLPADPQSGGGRDSKNPSAGAVGESLAAKRSEPKRLNLMQVTALAKFVSKKWLNQTVSNILNYPESFPIIS